MGVVKDIWDITKEVGRAVATPVGSYLGKLETRKKNLLLFKSEFAKQPRGITDFVDYEGFVEEESTFRSGAGRILSATHGEILRLWSRPEIIGPYEAFLRHHLDVGGELARVFVAGPELVMPGALKAFAVVLYRHHFLGFNPRVVSLSDLAVLRRSLQVDCDMFGVIGDSTAYFIRFSDRKPPLVVRSMHESTVLTASHAHQYLVKSSKDWESWLSNMPIELSTEDKKRVQDECAVIFGILGKFRNQKRGSK